MPFCVLIEVHPMMGVDFHFDLIPPAPAPVPTPFEPHGTVAMMNWLLPPSMANTVLAMTMRVMQRGTDIQNGIPHIPMGPGVLLSLPETAFSGSKSHFGPSSVQAGGKPVAVALLMVENLNLNCGTIPTPTGIVEAPNTVVTGMTLGDFLGGLFAMIADCALTTLMNCVFALGGIGTVPAGIIGLFTGSPLGFSFNANGHGPVGQVGRLMGNYSDAMRGFGEALGGDEAQGRADYNAAVDAAEKDLAYQPNPLDPTGGWNIFGENGDASRLQQPIPPPGWGGSNGLHDNPMAEHF
jgi:hypothetical protein